MNEQLAKALSALAKAKNSAVGYAKSNTPQGVKDYLKRINWGYLGTKDDARNAIIGSALGGLALGGASIMSNRDPEESKLAPVGDALIGALAGGAAGYGIPKGLSLFMDANNLSNNKKPTGAWEAHWKPSLLWGAVGSGGSILSSIPAFVRSRARLITNAKAGIKDRILKLRDQYTTTRESVHELRKRRDAIAAKAKVNPIPGVDYAARIAELDRDISAARVANHAAAARVAANTDRGAAGYKSFSRSLDKAISLAKEKGDTTKVNNLTLVKDILNKSRDEAKGRVGFRNIVRELPNEAFGAQPKNLWQRLTSGRRYSSGFGSDGREIGSFKRVARRPGVAGLLALLTSLGISYAPDAVRRIEAWRAGSGAAPAPSGN